MSDLRNLFLQLETTLGSGVSIVRALQLIAENIPWRLRGKVDQIAKSVDRGSTLSGAMASVGAPFTKMHVSFIRFGEEAGCLDKVCGALARHAEREQSVQQEIVNAMLYPGFVLGVALFMIPIINAIQAGRPWSEGVPAALLYIGGYAGVIIAGIAAWNTSLAGSVDAVLVHLPFIGGVMKQTGLARFTRTLSVGLAAGVPLVQALETSIEVCGNPWLEKQLAHLPRHVGGGKGLASGLETAGCLPGTLREMITVGEQSGRLPEMLDKTATFFEQEAANRVGMLMKVLPALLFLIVAVYVGYRIIGYWQGIFSALGN
ncbi:MAG TPA: type II secretion system F family protein [Candidatus Ozemobacteraceae bacterium]|nr:type II secretion system F family protein [Candidatus Ozemobacteraceae bacterium]